MKNKPETIKPKRKTELKPKKLLLSKKEKQAVSPHAHMFREAFLPDRRVRKPLLVREKPKRSGGVLPGAILLWVAFLSVTTYTLFFSDFHKIQIIELSGTKDISAEDIQSFVRDRLAEKTFRFFSQDNFFLAPTDSIRNDMLRAFPKLATASISRQFPDTIHIQVTERDRILLWCSGDPCSLVGDDGVAEDGSSSMTPSNEPFLLRIIDDGSSPVTIGEPLLDPKSASAIIRLAQALPDRAGIAVTSPMHSPSRVSDEVRITTKDGWDILANLTLDPDKTIASLLLVLDKEIPQDRRSVLRYIDLRTENKAFFAYSDWTPPPDPTATNPTATPATPTPIQSGTPTNTNAKKVDNVKK